jgi:hypothetical protein
VQVTSTRDKLELAFASSLRSAIAREEDRLAAALDEDASAALREVAGLRVMLGEQQREVARAVRAGDDARRERDEAVSGGI